MYMLNQYLCQHVTSYLLLLSVDAVHGDDVIHEVPSCEGAITVRVPIDAGCLVAHGIWEAITLRAATG